jgi:polysaccharide biosynthesis protein PslG
MTLRFVLILLTLILSLSISADRTRNECPEAWSPTSNPTRLDRGLGVNIHFTDPQPGEIKMIAAAGFRWVRMDFVWAETEKTRGRYDFSAYDRLLESLRPFDIGALLILDYANPLYDHGAPPRTEGTRRAFADWAAAAARHFAGRHVIWEIYNEPNNKMFWGQHPDVNEYVALALAVGRAFRAATPNEELIGPATGLDWPFLEACFKAGLLDYWTAVSVHPYRESDPEEAANDYCRLRKMIEHHRTRSSDGNTRTLPSSNGEVPIISGEWGYSSGWRGLTEEKQGALLAREMLTNLANDIPISIWYDWRDDGTDPKESEHHFGLVRNAYQAGRDPVFEPKPAYLAAQTLSVFLDGYAYQRRLPIGSDSDYVLVFSKGNELRLAAWTTSTSAHRVVIPDKAGTFRITKHNGESGGTVSATQEGLKIELSTAPLCLIQQPANR